MKKTVEKTKTVMTLANWLIKVTVNKAYRAGTLTGWKHPKVDQHLLDSVGGMQELLKQAKELEKDPLLGGAGKITFEWCNMGSDIRKINYDISIIPELCKREGIVEPRSYQLLKIERIEYWRGQVADCEWLLPYYDKIHAKLSTGENVSEIEDELLFQCLNAVARQKEFVWERVFSARVCNDSKKFKKYYRGRVLTILQHYSPYYMEGMSDDELLAMYEIHSYEQTLEWKGQLQYKIDDEFLIDTKTNRYGTVLNTQTIEHAMPYALHGCKKIMTIENKANYESMTYRDDTLYIFCHGYFTPKEVRFLKALVDIVPEECEFYHWGDMDYGGINIFQFIKEKLFTKLMPYKMDVAHFREAISAGAGIPLEESTRAKLEEKDAGILTELKNIILETNLTIEQECLL